MLVLVSPSLVSEFNYGSAVYCAKACTKIIFFVAANLTAASAVQLRVRLTLGFSGDFVGSLVQEVTQFYI